MIGARALEPITKRPRLIWNQFRIKTDRDDDHSSLSLSLYPTLSNLFHKEKYHFTADLLFDWFGFDLKSKAFVHSTKAKQLNPNK